MSRYPHAWRMAHPNAKGTGCALLMELHPAHDEVNGYILLRMARQKEAVARGTTGEELFEVFDWARSVRHKLGVSDVARISRVLQGYEESIEDGKGVFHRTATMNAILRFEHRIEPVNGYLLEVKRRRTDTPNAEIEAWDFLFSVCEAYALMLALHNALVYLMFGVPVVCEPPNGFAK